MRGPRLLALPLRGPAATGRPGSSVAPWPPGRRVQHAAVPLHHGGVAEELEPALAPQRPQCAHLLGSAGVPSGIVRGLIGTR